MPLRVCTIRVPAGLDEVVEQLHVEFVVLNDQHGLGHRAFHEA